MELAEYARVLLRRWWIIAISIVILSSAAYVLSLYQSPVYRAQATLVTAPSNSLKEVGTVLMGLDTLSRAGLMDTYKIIATSRAVVDAAAKQVGLPENELRHYQVTSDITQSSNVIVVTVQGPDPDTVVAMANQISGQAIRYVQSLYIPYDLKLLDQAVSPAEFVSPRPLQNLGLAGLLGLGLGIVLAFLAEYLRKPDDLVVEQNIIDPITGAHTRHYFMQRLNQELARSEHQNYPLSVALLQVENLDTLKGGRARELRNQALRQVAVCLRPHLRPEDLMARTGREQFAFLFPDLNDAAAEETMENLQGRIEWTAFELQPQRIKLNLSSRSGVISGRNASGADDLLAKAGQALEYAGSNGYNKIHLWHEQPSYAPQ